MSSTMNNNTPEINAVSMQYIVKKLGSVMDTENLIQMSMSNAMANFRRNMDVIAKDITKAGENIATEQKVLQGVKVVLTVLMVATIVVTLPTLPMSVGVGASNPLMAGISGGVLSSSDILQGGLGLFSGAGTIAEGGVDLKLGHDKSYAAKTKAVSTTLTSQLDTLSKGLDSSSETSKHLADAAGNLIENNYRAQIITNNRI